MKLAPRLGLSFTALLAVLVLCSAIASVYSLVDTLGEESRYLNNQFAIDLVKLAPNEVSESTLQEELQRHRLAYLRIERPDGKVVEAIDSEAKPLELSAISVTLNNHKISMANSRERVRAEAMEATGRQLAVTIPLSLLVWLVGLYGVNRLIQPLKVLEAETARVASFRDKSEEKTSSLELLKLSKSKDEAGELAQSFLAMESELLKTLDELKKSIAKQERIDTELRVGRELQQGLLPEPIEPKPEFQLASHLRPAKEMSGDLFHHFWLDDKLLVAVGDVSGKGVSAALLMAVAQTLIRHVTQEGECLSEAVEKLNNHMCEDNPMAYFLTLFIALYEPQTGRFEYVNAGHPRPLVRSGNGKIREVAGTRGMGLGVVPHKKFESAEDTLGKGETLVLYTDGATEAANSEGQLFDHRLSDTLAKISGDANATIRGLVKEIEDFEGADHATDDLTLLVLQRC